jgi:hypothetical protein
MKLEEQEYTQTEFDFLKDIPIEEFESTSIIDQAVQYPSFEEGRTFVLQMYGVENYRDVLVFEILKRWAYIFYEAQKVLLDEAETLLKHTKEKTRYRPNQDLQDLREVLKDAKNSIEGLANEKTSTGKRMLDICEELIVVKNLMQTEQIKPENTKQFGFNLNTN